MIYVFSDTLKREMRRNREHRETALDWCKFICVFPVAMAAMALAVLLVPVIIVIMLGVDFAKSFLDWFCGPNR